MVRVLEGRPYLGPLPVLWSESLSVVSLEGIQTACMGAWGCKEMGGKLLHCSLLLRSVRAQPVIQQEGPDSSSQWALCGRQLVAILNSCREMLPVLRVSIKRKGCGEPQDNIARSRLGCTGLEEPAWGQEVGRAERARPSIDRKAPIPSRGRRGPVLLTHSGQLSRHLPSLLSPVGTGLATLPSLLSKCYSC